MKHLLITLIFLIALISLPFQVSAQTVKSPCAVTKVGNPTVSPPTPENCVGLSGDTSGIVPWAKKINDELDKGLWGYFNRFQADISNNDYHATKRQGFDTGVSPSGIYWCTFIVVDSYHLAGLPDLGPEQWGVINMENFFATVDGYDYIDYRANPEQALTTMTPGNAIFFVQSPGVHTGHEHTGIVAEKIIDSSGNGKIVAYESNNAKQVLTYPVDSWVVKNTPYPLTGFGTASKL